MRCAARSRCSRRCPSATRVSRPDNRIELRIGINLGDVIVEGDDLYGDGVNIAARIEALADPGGVFVSNTVHDQVRDRLPFVFEDLGEQQVKNIARPVRVYRVRDRRRVKSRIGASSAGAAAPRQAVDRGAAVRQYERRPGAGIFRRRHGRGDHHRLSRIRWLFVIARNSSFTYKGRAVDVKQVGRELGVAMCSKARVRKAGSRVRITGAADRCHNRRASLGRPLRRLARRRVRRCRTRSPTASPASSSRALQAAETARSPARADRQTSTPTTSILRALPHRSRVTRERIPEALRLARAGDRARSALRAGARLLLGLCELSLRSSATAGPKHPRQPRQAQAASCSARRSQVGETTQTSWPMPPIALVIRRGHRRHDRARRSGARAQPELRPRLVCERRPVADLGGSTRARDRASSNTALRLSPRDACRLSVSLAMGHGPFLSDAQFDEAAAKLRIVDSRRIQDLPGAIAALAACYAPYGAARRSAGDRRAAARYHLLP